MSISGRGRPASVDVDPQNIGSIDVQQQQQIIEPNPGVLAVTRKNANQGMTPPAIS